MTRQGLSTPPKVFTESRMVVDPRATIWRWLPGAYAIRLLPLLNSIDLSNHAPDGFVRYSVLLREPPQRGARHCLLSDGRPEYLRRTEPPGGSQATRRIPRHAWGIRSRKEDYR